LNRGEKIASEFIVPGGDGAKVLKLIEKALDEIALAVERKVTFALGLSICFGRNDRGDFPRRKTLDQRIGVVSLVADQGVRIGIFDQRLGANQIVNLSGREHQVGGIAQGIDEGVNFRCQSATRTADCLIAVFFWAPALC